MRIEDFKQAEHLLAEIDELEIAIKYLEPKLNDDYKPRDFEVDLVVVSSREKSAVLPEAIFKESVQALLTICNSRLKTIRTEFKKL